MSSPCEVRLVARPNGTPTQTDFELVPTVLRTVGEGDVLVRNTILSVDPYMRRRMSDVESYVPSFELGQAMTGGAIGEVLESSVDHLRPGDLVVHDRGWRTHAVLRGTRLSRLEVGAGVDPAAYLGVLGMPGLTAYVGLTRIARMVEGDAVFVSAAAGAVGSLVGQLARRRGASRVIGSAGSAAKVSHLVDDLGFDVGIDYRATDVRYELAAACPDGLDVYFDNVGGDHLEAALLAMNNFGRIAVCGWISAYDDPDDAPVVHHLPSVLWKRITMQGFIVSDHAGLVEEFRVEVEPLVASGQVVSWTTERHGIDQAVEGFLSLMSGANTGKMLIRLDE